MTKVFITFYSWLDSCIFPVLMEIREETPFSVTNTNVSADTGSKFHKQGYPSGKDPALEDIRREMPKPEIHAHTHAYKTP